MPEVCWIMSKLQSKLPIISAQAAMHPGKYLIFLMEFPGSGLGPRHDRSGDAAVSRHARPRPGPHSAPGTLYPAPLSFSISRGKEASEKLFLTTYREPKVSFSSVN